MGFFHYNMSCINMLFTKKLKKIDLRTLEIAIFTKNFREPRTVGIPISIVP